ncbi:MAG TPA: cytochrome P450 [Burkholderiales bacterium]|nr:cytochrome P450 [Burkholderiales bacterium]
MSSPLFGQDADRELAQSFQLVVAPDDFIENPYRWYALLRVHDPVHRLGDESMLLTRYEDVVEVYRSAAASSDKRVEFKPKFGDTLLYEHHTTSLVFNDPPLHTRVRRRVMGALNQRAIARMEPDVSASVDRLLNQLEDKRHIDLIEHLAAQIPIEVIGNLLGVPRAERGPLRGWSLAILSALEPLPSPEILDRGNRAVAEFLDYLRRLVDDRKRHPLDADSDVLTRLIRRDLDGDALSERELLHNCIFLLNAGHETTTNLIGNGVHALLVHRDQLERLQAEPHLLATAVEELLRFESPLQLNNRVLTAPIELAGQRLAAGTFITLGVGAANRDPAQFPDPDRLDIARKPNRHLAFGHGDHACAGMNVARLEAHVAIGKLVSRFPKIALRDKPERDPRVRFRGFRRLPVTLT